MRQRTAVRALVRYHDQTLLLRRANGRESILGRYELPGGKIAYNEQPEDALRRYLEKDAGVIAQSVQLFDVLSYIDHDDQNMQYVFIVYLVQPVATNVILSENYDKAIWQSKSKIQRRDITESSRLLLGLSDGDTAANRVDEAEVGQEGASDYRDEVIVYSDGGSRGNPGHSAAAYVIETAEGDVIETGGQYLGITTSQQAEYHGLLMGLERALELGYKTLEYRLDSLMVVNQMKGIYTVKNRDLWPVNERITDLLTQFESVTFTHVRREFNTKADGEVNRILNEHEQGASDGIL